MDNPKFWDFLAKQNQEDFRSSGTAGSCIEARELIISLPEEFQKYDREQLLKLFAMKFKLEYGTDAIAALHHNKAMTNYHIHLIFSERKLMEHAEFKKASRNMFFNEHGKHVRTKKEILDEHGEIRKGCYIVAKGDTYDIRNFQSKETIFKSKVFTARVKEMYTDFINELVKEDQNKLTVFRHDGPYLATKKIGKYNPKEAEIKEDNAKRQEWNHAVDEALTAGLPEKKICQVKKDCIQNPIHESIKKTGFHPDLLSAILQVAIRTLLDLIRTIPKKVHKEPVFNAEVFRRMQGVRKDLLHQNQMIAAARRRCERAQVFSAEASKPANIFKRNMKTKAAKELSASLLEYEKAIAEPDKIVKRAGYKNVAAFTRAYEKSCKLLESIRHKEGDKRSALAKLEQYETAAKMQNQKKTVPSRQEIRRYCKIQRKNYRDEPSVFTCKYVTYFLNQELLP